MPDDIREGGADKRLERRIAATLPVTLDAMDGAAAMTRDVSASGLFLETDAVLVPGSAINLMVELDTPSGKRILKCSGNVVRVGRLNEKIGCGVKILESCLVWPD